MFKDYQSLKKAYSKSKLFGLACSFDASNCNDFIKDKKKITKYVHLLCSMIDMKRYGETELVKFGDTPEVSGYSMTQLIETSLISGHFVDSTNDAYIDIFSCKIYDPWVVASFTSHYFGTKEVGTIINLRQAGEFKVKK